MRIYYNIYRVIRSIIVTALLGAVSLFMLLYLLLLLPAVQQKIRTVGESELSKLIHAPVSIGDVSIAPFNRVMLSDVLVSDVEGDTILSVDKLGAGVSLYNLVMNRRLVFTFAEIIGLDARISKAAPDAPLNIQFIIDALSGKDKTKPPTKFDVKIYNAVIRKSRLSYDLLSASCKADRFDANHIMVDGFTADIYFPKIKNNDFEVYIKRLALNERSGLRIDRISADVVVNDTVLSVKNFRVELPNSVISPEDFGIKYSSLKNLSSEIRDVPIDFRLSNSYVSLSDLQCFNPKLRNINEKILLTLAVKGNLRSLHIPVVSVATENSHINLSLSGNIRDLLDPDMKYSFPHIDVRAGSDEIIDLATDFTSLKPKVIEIIERCNFLRLNGSVSGNSLSASFLGNAATGIGNLDIDGRVSVDTLHRVSGFVGRVATKRFELGTLLGGGSQLGATSFSVNADMSKIRSSVSGSVNGDINFIEFKGYRYCDISADLSLAGNRCEGKLFINDKNAEIIADGYALIAGENSEFDISLDVANVNLANLNLWNKYPDKLLGFVAGASFTGDSPDNAVGSVKVEALRLASSSQEQNLLDSLSVTASGTGNEREIVLNSDLINGKIKGACTFKSLVPQLKNIAGAIFPSLLPVSEIEPMPDNDFSMSFKINPDNRILELLGSPVRIIYPIDIYGAVNTATKNCWLNLEAPYLQNKNKVIESSAINITVDGSQNACSLTAQTIMPNKKGDMAVNLNINGVNNRIDTDASWKIANPHDYSGNINISTSIAKSESDKLMADLIINPTLVHVNDTVWNILPATVRYADNRIEVKNIEVRSDNQFAKIDGAISSLPEDSVSVKLQNINLNYIFETLAINNVTFGGDASGDFVASQLLTKSPRISTPGLSVKSLSYNNSLLGDALIRSEWLNESKGISLHADISQPNTKHSYVDGAIFPMNDSLYLDFNVERIDVRFLQPFMSAFTSKIGGYASGHGTLLGDFKRINFFGDVKPEPFKIKIDYLNTEYTTEDSVHIKLNDIDLHDITIRDKNNRTAKLNGHIYHDNFHNARINLAITDADELLCFDTDASVNPTWYGTIYGNGSAFITGEPGYLSIDVNMSTAPASKFTFVLSDQEAAGDYKFITITDRNKPKEEVQDSVPEIVRQLKAGKSSQTSTPTVLDLNLNVEATPQAQMILVMDPNAGDRIKANGSGNLKLNYNTVDDALSMHGKYTLEKGNYNFTLQDIIIKDFTIREGSSISFNGDPLSATLDISAIYAVNANLTDLDESFAMDKDMNRTNVPVHAVLNAKGEINQPEVSFDLAFPTLTQDAYRKVKSIVSTDDMMNRQIIYLLALSRFYTPEYTGAQSQNNELVSVASSTISSQLANILGQVSENISIAPNFRSNKGDFSDMEVDVALSSQLLNNRLLLNGNFGYRDKTLNANGSTFIGDFDIEYLLTKNGNIRLKAYNHYNDQNYYIKSALTTQGVGVVFKHDFNRLFDFIRRNPKVKKQRNDTVPVYEYLKRDSVE